jgi:tetratricopeptide (TPR) repeat protein
MELGAALPQEAKIRAGALSLIGSSLRSEGRLEEALEALQQARQVAERADYANPTERAMDMYAILLREGRTLGQDGGVSLGRISEAIAVYQKAVDLMEEQSSKDPREQNARDRLALCSRELAELLVAIDPEQSLAFFNLGIQRSREVKNNIRARRREAQALAESSYALRRLGRVAESRKRIDEAFALLRKTKDYPSENISADGEVVAALRAQADYEAQVGDRRRAAEINERLLTSMMTASLVPLDDLSDATRLSTMYRNRAVAYRRAGESAKADEIDIRRLELWRRWDVKLPRNGFVQRQLVSRSE